MTAQSDNGRYLWSRSVFTWCSVVVNIILLGLLFLSRTNSAIQTSDNQHESKTIKRDRVAQGNAGTTKIGSHQDSQEPKFGCKRQPLPQPMNKIPLSPQAFEMDHGKLLEYKVGTLNNNRGSNNNIRLALPLPFAGRIQANGRFDRAGNSDNILALAHGSDPAQGAFVDVGGWVGDSSIPSAALGFDTFVFEPVRQNTNFIHHSTFLNDCNVSEHLVIVNTLVGDQDLRNQSIFVPHRTDNAAATKELALNVIKTSDDKDYEQPVEMIQLDSFFPPGFVIQNLKIDVQGFELHVLRGAQRILKENKGRLRLRYESHEGLLRKAGTSPQEVKQFMIDLGYKVVAEVGIDVDMK